MLNHGNIDKGLDGGWWGTEEQQQWEAFLLLSLEGKGAGGDGPERLNVRGQHSYPSMAWATEAGRKVGWAEAQNTPTPFPSPHLSPTSASH